MAEHAAAAAGGLTADGVDGVHPTPETAAQSKPPITITEAGLESQADGTANVLVAVTVTTSNTGALQADSHAWRIRVLVRRVGDQAKVSKVEFVS